jgi:hypothetical protein
MNEALSAHVNTLEYLNELYGTLENQTYMLYDNDKYAGMPSYKMMDLVNTALQTMILQKKYITMKSKKLRCLPI